MKKNLFELETWDSYYKKHIMIVGMPANILQCQCVTCLQWQSYK